MTLTDPNTATVKPLFRWPRFGRLAEVTDDELARYASLIYERTGFAFHRRRRRCCQTVCGGGCGRRGPRVRRLLPPHCGGSRRRTPNGTRSCRRSPPTRRSCFETRRSGNWFRAGVPARVRAQARGSRPRALRIWSRGLEHRRRSVYRRLLHCRQSGKPRTVADPHPGHRHRNRSGPAGQAASFGERAMRLVPDSYRKRYFRRSPGGNLWQACPVLTQMTDFRQHNLMDPLRDGPFDLVFLKRADLLRPRVQAARDGQCAIGHLPRRAARGRARRGNRRDGQGFCPIAAVAIPTAAAVRGEKEKKTGKRNSWEEGTRRAVPAKGAGPLFPDEGK